MAQDLRFELKENTNYVASKTDGTEFTFNSGASGTYNASRIMSPATVYVSDSDSYYYTFTAATAGTLGSSIYLPEGSLCPKGWRIPVVTARYGATYSALFTAYSATTFATAKALPLEFKKNGRTNYSTGALYSYNASNESASTGAYWTAQAQDPSIYLIYVASFDATAAGTPSGSNHAYYHTGFTIRCVAI